MPAYGNRGRRFVPPLPPSSGADIFSDDFSLGNFTRWNSCQWKGRNDDCQTYNGTSDYSMTVVAIDGRDHVMRSEIRDGDVPPFGGQERSEIADPGGGIFVVEGDIRWIAWDMKFDSTFPTPTDWGCTVHQERAALADGTASSGSPPVWVGVESDDHLYVENPNPAPEWKQSDAGQILRNVWRRYVLNVKYSPDPAVGYWQLNIDGVSAVPKTFGYTMRVGYPHNYFKLGQYRSDLDVLTSICYFDNFAISSVAIP